MNICGERGFCAPIAAYYICDELSVAVVEILQKELHTEISTSESNNVFVTDGTYTIIHKINQNLPTTSLQKIFPTKDPTTHPNALFGDKDECGRFLIELRDINVSSIISHFVSLDTYKLEIYDPISVVGSSDCNAT